MDRGFDPSTDRSLPIGALRMPPRCQREIVVVEAPGEWPYMAIWVAAGRIQMRYLPEHSAAVLFCVGLLDSGHRPKLYCEERMSMATDRKVIIEGLPETILQELQERREGRW